MLLSLGDNLNKLMSEHSNFAHREEVKYDLLNECLID